MAQLPQVSELDILAYGDGLLDDDPAHRAAVERALRADPKARARAEAFRAQTEALRAAYGGRLAEPVPDRLHAALERDGRRSFRAPLHVAAMLALLVTAAAGGWMLGHKGGNTVGDGGLQRLADGIHARFATSRPGSTAPQMAAPEMTTAAHGRPFDWISDELSIRLRAPDLSANGYTLAGTQAVTIDGERLVRLDYAGAEGPFSVFIAPRWKPGTSGITQTGREDVSMAYWENGPLASMVVARMPAPAVRRLAEALRDAIRESGEAPAVVEPVPAGPGKLRGDVVADTLGDPATGLPQPGRGQTGAVRPN